ncbi:Adenylate cyclase [Fulvivirga imtechensis AK7]|uniref:Adenylate cyclase n=1 Tax=Fulvivirga imtechensis AK7 TaxID=1237149 RepID=L8JS06_9BACT|nr:adenylate/guanylate cyclase domain-containing protein [Fulvivirga imtechensis]ELR70239.1 Adenylate cyclase [Fulvivirga imtechensis AK7]
MHVISAHSKERIIGYAWWITLYWLIIGLFAFGYETILLSQEWPVNLYIFALGVYTLPPVIFGLPFLILEQLFVLKWMNMLNFYLALIIRSMLYLMGIIAAYSLIQYFGPLIFPATFFKEPFLLKFIFVWGLGSILALLFYSLSSKHDPKMFMSWLRGEYHKPKQEDRVFLFCDINKSTPVAERLGSRLYFDFLNEFYSFITPIIQRYEGEVYQYVGDEIVISWPLQKGLANNNALELFFEIKAALEKKAAFFLKSFHYAPTIKGSLHVGQITKGELNAIKKEFIYTGDVLNTTSRMYAICKEKDVPLVISRGLLEQFSEPDRYVIHDEGYFLPRGKQEKIYIYSIPERQSP